MRHGQKERERKQVPRIQKASTWGGGRHTDFSFPPLTPIILAKSQVWPFSFTLLVILPRHLWRIGSRNPYRYQVLQMLKSLIENGIITAHNLYTSFPGGTDGKKSACNARDPGSICGSRRSPGEGHGNPLQYSCLENPMDRGAWWTRTIRSQWIGHDSVTNAHTIHAWHILHLHCLL